jgi:AcrR family transcriptional regulator
VSNARVAPRFLDRDAVVRAAADLADRDGWRAVTLSQVAKEVDRHVTSLYAHVDSLAALRRAVALLAIDELSDAVWRAALGKVRGEALQAIAEEYRGYAISFPGRAAAITSEHDTQDTELAARGARLAEPVRATLRSFGLDDRQAAVAHHVFSATIDGFVHTRRGKRDFDQAVGLFLLGLSSGEWPAA